MQDTTAAMESILLYTVSANRETTVASARFKSTTRARRGKVPKMTIVGAVHFVGRTVVATPNRDMFNIDGALP